MAEWPIMSLREAGVILIDCVHATPAAEPFGYPYIAIPDMKDGRIDFSKARRISEIDFEKWTTKARPRRHDVVLSRRTNPGVTATVGEECAFALGQNLVLLRADGSRVLPEFLKWLVAGPDWWAQISKFLNVGAVFDSLKCADVPRFQLPIPPRHEQQRIVSILGALDDKIDLNRRMNETLEAMARALFKDWFVDFGPTRANMEGRPPYLASDLWALFPDRLDDEGKPEGWASGRLDAYAVLNPESWSKTTYPPEIEYVDLAGTKRGFIQQTDRYESAQAPSRAQRILREGDTVVGTVRPGNGSYAYVSRAGLTGSTGFAVLRPRDTKVREFVYLAATAAENIERLSHLADGAAYPAVRPDVVLDTDVVLCGEDTLAAFNRTVGALIAAIYHNDSQSISLAATRDLLLPKLMSGEIRVRDAEKMVEPAL